MAKKTLNANEEGLLETKTTSKKKSVKKAAKKVEKILPAGIGLKRRNVRYRLFRIREGNDLVVDDLKTHIETQFEFGMTWKTFSFTWDVSPRDPLKVISPDQWDEEGGGYDPVTGVRAPTAFTHQS